MLFSHSDRTVCTRSSGFFFAVETGSCGELALMGGVGGRRVLLPYTVYKAINHVCYVRAKVIHVHYMAGEFS